MSLNLKLPHWAQIVMSLVGVLLAWVLAQNSSGSLVLPAALVGVLSLVNGALGLVTSSALSKPMVDAAPAMGGVEASVASATAAGTQELQASEPKS